jgi:ubiquitin C-terminal hydrolase
MLPRDTSFHCCCCPLLAGGHYTADALQADGTWLRFNDTCLEAVSPAAVLKEQPYMLMYQHVA